MGEGPPPESPRVLRMLPVSEMGPLLGNGTRPCAAEKRYAEGNCRIRQQFKANACMVQWHKRIK